MRTDRIIVCGGRGYCDARKVRAVLGAFAGEDLVIVHGDAGGADRLARDAAIQLGFEVEAYPAAWHVHGPAAGPIRNQEMVDAGADLVIAFPGGRGTADCVRRAEAAGIPVRRAT